MPQTQLNRVIHFALTQIDEGETTGPNAGPYIEKIARASLTGRVKGNWCALFVRYCFEATQVIPIASDRIRRGAKGSTKHFVSDLETGRWIVQPRGPLAPRYRGKPTRGDIITHNRKRSDSAAARLDWRGHTGLVTGYDATTDTLRVVEGNVGRFPSTVQEFEYPHGDWRHGLWALARIGALHGERP